MSGVNLSSALFTKTQQRVLGLLFSQPDKSFYTNEIVRWAGMGTGTVRRELLRLVDAGLLVVSHEGNQRHYKANPQCPIYGELLSIVRKTFGITDVIKEALSPMSDQVELAFVYGSVAKATDTSSSDIDLMLVGDDLSYAEVMGLLLPLEESLSRPINPTIYSRSEFKNKLQKNNSFLTRVLEQPKLMIKGTEDDIRKLR